VTNAAIRLLALSAAALGLMAASPAHADVVLYGITFSGAGGAPTPGQLITINTTTGAGTAVGTLDSGMASYGLAALNNNLYTYDQVASPNLIRQLDPATGHTLASTNIGTGALTGEGDFDFRSDGTGFLSGDGNRFLSFNLSAGTSTPIGTQNFLFDGLAFRSDGVLFGLSQGFSSPNGSSLYTINTTTGAVSLIGALNVPAAASELLGGLAFGPNGTLYAELSDGSTTSPSTLYTVNTATGQATLVGSIGFASVSGIRFLNTSPTAVPEPSSLALCGIAGALGLAVARARRKRAA
jgi:hypothetical protein